LFTTSHRKAVVSVINDLVSDVRVQKTCMVLQDLGYEVTLIGRILPSSPPLPAEWTFKTHRMNLLFKKGVPFYVFFNIRLFFKLLFLRADVLFANDLDTLGPNYFVSKIKGIPLIYDSHELFCEVPELQNSPFKKKTWEFLERMILPKLKYAITVNASIADFYRNRYGCNMQVVRNIPPVMKVEVFKSRKELGIEQKEHVFVLQGAGINIHRGAEELVLSMKYIDNALLLIIGSGDVWPVLEKLVQEQGLTDKVRLMKRLPKNELIQYTRNADVGISIDKGTNLNYQYSLPNKLFDYIQCGIPVLASRMVEIENIVSTYQIGDFIDSHDPSHIAEKLKDMTAPEKQRVWRKNTEQAKKDLNWDTEKEVLIKLVTSIHN
jgi:glycosyltransferase involved in cell wall biosynthesis